MVRNPEARPSGFLGRACLAAACCSALLAGPGGARAADWTFESSASQRLGYDDNVGLNRQNKVSDLSSLSTVRLDLLGSEQSQSLDFGISSRFDYTAFLEERDLNSDDQRVALFGDYQTALSRWGLTAAYSRDTTRTRDEDDTGEFILENVRRHEVEVRPSWTYLLSELDSITLRGGYDNVQFEEQLVDFWRLSGEVGWIRKLSQTAEVDLSAFASLTKPDELERQTQVYGLKAGWSSTPIRDLEIRFGIGGYWARTDFGASSGRGDSLDDQASIGLLPSAGLSYQLGQDATIAAAYSRDIRPSGGGGVLERDRLEASFEQVWSPRGSWRVDFLYQFQNALDDLGGGGRDLIRVSPSIAWRFTENWSVRGAYRLRWQSLEGEGEDALSNAVFVTMTYEP